jgi:predicted ABC-type ATPase
MTESPRPQLVMLAGPNGAGKSTFYRSFLADSPFPFPNADVMAARAEIDSLEAARVLDALRDDFVDRGQSFITETVFSDPVRAELGLLERAIARGYDVIVLFVGAEKQLLGLRVDQRVSAGGHDVPRERLLTRFERSLDNLRIAIRLRLTAKIYDNSSVSQPHRLLAVYERGRRTYVVADLLPHWAKPVIGKARRRR